MGKVMAVEIINETTYTITSVPKKWWWPWGSKKSSMKLTPPIPDSESRIVRFKSQFGNSQGTEIRQPDFEEIDWVDEAEQDDTPCKVNPIPIGSPMFTSGENTEKIPRVLTRRDQIDTCEYSIVDKHEIDNKTSKDENRFVLKFEHNPECSRSPNVSVDSEENSGQQKR